MIGSLRPTETICKLKRSPKRHAELLTMQRARARARLAGDETELLRNDMVFGFCIETRFSVG